MTIELPVEVNDIINTLQEAGFEAYAVGGCVRDTLLGRVPDDWDITTSAKPQDVKALFRRTIDTGIQHGTVTVMVDKEGFEVTTYRIDGEYEDSRHPKEVVFTPNLIEDLKRRDFTINAMAYNASRGLVDEFQGCKDIERKLIRCVGEPRERFKEDALRIMRGIRFAAQLGYTIEKETGEAIKELSPNLKNISAERIQVELIKLLISDHPGLIRTAYEAGITSVVLPEFDLCMETEQINPHHCYSVGEHTIKSIENIRADKVLRLTMLLHDIGKPLVKTTSEDGIDHFYKHQPVGEELAKKILRRLKFDNDTIKSVTTLVKYHDYQVRMTSTGVRRAMNTIGEDLFSLFLEVKAADLSAQSSYMRKEKEETLVILEALYHEIIEKKECVSIKSLPLMSSVLIAIGFQPGRILGETLQKLLDMVIENPELNVKSKLIEEAKVWL